MVQTPIEELAAEGHFDFQRRGSMLLISIKDCELVLEACRAGRFRILGVEAIHLEADHIRPVMDMIADYSESHSKDWITACVDSADWAGKVLDSAGSAPQLWIEFVLVRAGTR